MERHSYSPPPMITRANNNAGALRRAQKKIVGRVVQRKIVANRRMTHDDMSDLRIWLRAMRIKGAYSTFYSSIDPPVFVMTLYIGEEVADKTETAIRLRLAK